MDGWLVAALAVAVVIVVVLGSMMAWAALRNGSDEDDRVGRDLTTDDTEWMPDTPSAPPPKRGGQGEGTRA